MPTFRGTSLPLSDLGVESNNKSRKVKDGTDTYEGPNVHGYIKEPTDRTNQSSQWPGGTAKASVDQSW